MTPKSAGVLAPAVLAGTAAAGLVALLGMAASGHNTRQYLDLANQRRRDLSTPMPDFSTVKAAYLQFATKHANGDMPMSFGSSMGQGAMQGVGKGFGDALGDMLIRKPLDIIGSLLKKKFYTEPKQRQVFDDVVGADPDLATMRAQHPSQLADAHASLKRFSPSQTEDKNALRAYLRHAMHTQGTVDSAMIKQLADTELTHRRARGEVK